MARGTIFQINASRGGVPKLPIAEAVVTERGLTVDAQADSKHHGSPAQALCLFALETIREVAGEGNSIAPGSAGENITTEGLDWRLMVPGTRLRLGSGVLAEVTGYATPCWKNAQWFADGDFNRINQKLHPGSSRVYARVLAGGAIRAGDEVELIEESAAARVARQQVPTVRWPRDFQAKESG